MVALKMVVRNLFTKMHCVSIDDYAKDGGEEIFPKMHRALKSNFYRIVKDS